MLNQDTVREATRLTRAGRLVEATALLQGMLRGDSAPSQTSRSAAQAPLARLEPQADAIEGALDDMEAAQARAKSLRERIFLHFSQKAMVEGVLAGYHDAFANR